MKSSHFLHSCLVVYCLLLGNSQLWSQTKFTVAGGHLVQADSNVLVLKNTALINNGVISSAVSTVLILGDSTDELSAIGGSSVSTFYNLQINKSTNGAQLQQNIEVDNQLLMTKGHIDLNGDTITLASASGMIVNESDSSRVKGSTGGIIQKTVDLAAPNNENPGNLGLQISSSQNLGSTLIQRSHAPQSLHDTSSIERSFQVFPSNNTSLGATIQFYYLDAELNGHPDSTLSPWRQDSAFWYNPVSTTVDTSNNYVQVDSIDFFSHWTLAPDAPKLEVRVLLAGPYDSDSSEMTDDLRSSDIIPTAEPYAALGYTHPASGGGEAVNPTVFDRTDSDAIVDWVFVELRDSNDLTNIIAARSALLQKDGDVVDLDGYSNLLW